MNKSFKFLLITIIMLISANALFSQTQVIIRLKVPPLNRLNLADLYSASITNSGEPFTAYLYGSMMNNENSEMIATGQTMTFDVKKGMTNFKISDLPRVPDVNYTARDPKYKQSFMNTGGAPPGDYKICIELRRTNNEVAGEDCITQKITGGDAPQLISPKRDEDLDIDWPLFTWMHMKSPGSTEGYTLKIVELKGEESPENAMLKNKAFFEKEGITQQLFQYPTSANKFEAGKKYAWQVSIGDLKSEISIFDRWGNLIFSELRLISPVNGATLDGDSVVFRWGPVKLSPTNPNEPKYRLRVWQLMQGQTNLEAIIQPPLLGNDVGNVTQFTITNLASVVSCPCDFVWNVQALNKDGNPVGGNNGTSETFKFKKKIDKDYDWSEDKKKKDKDWDEDKKKKDRDWGEDKKPGNKIGDIKSEVSIFDTLGNAIKKDISFCCPVVTDTKGVIKFSWESNSNGPFTLKIVEIIGDESPKDAILKNKAFFEKEGISQQTFQYPDNAPKFVTGKTYAWDVTYWPWINHGEIMKIVIGNTPQPISGLTALDSEGKILFSWQSNSEGPFTLKIVELNENETPEDVFLKSKPFFEKEGISEQKFLYPADAPKLKKEKIYAWGVQVQATYSPWVYGYMKRDGAEISQFISGAVTVLDPESKLNFSWQSNSEGPFTLKIVEIIGDETPEDAMLKNKAFFEKEGISEQKFQYPSDAPGFVNGKKYAWLIKTGNTQSGIGTFKKLWTDFNIHDPGITLSSPENGSSVSSYAVTFRWTPVIPVPKDGVTYELKVWQLMEGQNGGNAFRGNKPIIEKDYKVNTATIQIIDGPCKPPYLCNFEWEVQAIDVNGKPVGGKNGTIETYRFKISENTIPVSLTFPENNSVVSSNTVAFRWTPVIPVPKDGVTYKLKVWQLMEGQNGLNAFRGNKPIFEKDYKVNTATIQIIDGPCKPPYLCDFVWEVQAFDAVGKPVGENNGISEMFKFKINK